MIPPWVVGLALLALVALLSWAVGWVMGRESSECRRQGEPPCRHRRGEREPCHHLGGERTSFPCMDAYDDLLFGRITREEYGRRRDSFSVTTCLDCGARKA